MHTDQDFQINTTGTRFNPSRSNEVLCRKIIIVRHSIYQESLIPPKERGTSLPLEITITFPVVFTLKNVQSNTHFCSSVRIISRKTAHALPSTSVFGLFIPATLPQRCYQVNNFCYFINKLFNYPCYFIRKVNNFCYYQAKLGL